MLRKENGPACTFVWGFSDRRTRSDICFLRTGICFALPAFSVAASGATLYLVLYSRAYSISSRVFFECRVLLTTLGKLR
jgi:hypothetical protein